MTVYVDTPITYATEPAGYVGRARPVARWGHMIADTLDELHAMARRIGLRREWFQPRSTPHYDLVPTKREAAMRAGAVALERREFVAVLRRVRAAATVAEETR